MLRIAIIGLGVISKVHIEVIESIKEAKLVALCDTKEERGDKYKDIPFYTDYKEMLEKENLDCVHICLPHYLHYPVAKYCIEHGVHVLEEKPLALNTDEALNLVNLTKSSDKKLGVCFQNRKNDSVEKMIELVRNNDYGKVVGMKGIVAWNRPLSYFKESPWRGELSLAGSGVMINQAIHVLDLMQLIGGEIESIKGTTSKLLDFPIDVEDTAVANINFKNGARGLFLSSIANSIDSSIELEVELEHGRLTIKGDTLFLRTKANKEEILVKDAKFDGDKFYYGSSHKKLIDQFYQAIINDTDDYVSAQEAMESIKIIDCIKLSSKTNEVVNYI